jgi:hypothetical protein
MRLSWAEADCPDCAARPAATTLCWWSAGAPPACPAPRRCAWCCCAGARCARLARTTTFTSRTRTHTHTRTRTRLRHLPCLGLGLIAAFSVGLATVPCLLGLLLVRARGFMDHLSSRAPRTQRFLPVGSAVIVTLLGAAMTLQALRAYLS